MTTGDFRRVAAGAMEKSLIEMLDVVYEGPEAEHRRAEL